MACPEGGRILSRHARRGMPAQTAAPPSLEETIPEIQPDQPEKEVGAQRAGLEIQPKEMEAGQTPSRRR